MWVEELRLQLQRSGLIPSDATLKEIQWINSLLMSGLLGLGVLRLVLGIMKGHPVGFLITMMSVFLAVGSGLGELSVPFRTRKGDEAMEIAEARYDHIKSTSSSIVGLESQVLLSAFAIYGGTILLGDPALATLGNMIEPPFWSSSGDGGGDDGCGGGGCGGGCGG